MMLNRLLDADKLNEFKLKEINEELNLYLRPLQHCDVVLLQLRKLIQLLKKPQIVLADDINQQKTILALSLILMRINQSLRSYEMSDIYAAIKKIIGIYPTDLEILDYLKDLANQKLIDDFILANVKDNELSPVDFSKPLINVLPKNEIKLPNVPTHINRKSFFLPKIFYPEEKNTESNNPFKNFAKKM